MTVRFDVGLFVLAGGSHSKEEAWEGSQGLSERIQQTSAGFPPPPTPAGEALQGARLGLSRKVGGFKLLGGGLPGAPCRNCPRPYCRGGMLLAGEVGCCQPARWDAAGRRGGMLRAGEVGCCQPARWDAAGQRGGMLPIVEAG